ncbi:MAG: TfoX/Sxy family protein [Sandaracinaceae bacterium]
MANPKKATSAAFEDFVALFDADDVTRGSLFGMPCLKRGKKAFAGSFDGGLVVKLPPDEAAEAAAVPGAQAFDPSGKGRPMKGWVVLPASAAETWPRWAAAAYDAV